MKKWKSDLFPVITLAVCLGLAACGSESEGSSTSQEDYEETENSVPESYDLLNDGRGDLIPEERIPVLMGGALPLRTCRTCAQKTMRMERIAMRISRKMDRFLW